MIAYPYLSIGVPALGEAKVLKIYLIILIKNIASDIAQHPVFIIFLIHNKIFRFFWN